MLSEKSPRPVLRAVDGDGTHLLTSAEHECSRGGIRELTNTEAWKSESLVV